MDWIIGNWVLTSEKGSMKTTYEKWYKVSNSEYKGHGYIIDHSVVEWEEHMKLFKANDEWNFEVIGVNESPTNFKIISLNDTSFTASNLENDFPTHITYFKEGELLKAKVFNGEKEIDFEFERL